MLTIDNNYLLDVASQTWGNQALKGLKTDKQLSLSIDTGVDFIDVGGGDMVKPVLTLFNRNDGNTALRFKVGLFRLVCTNGLMLPSSLGLEARIIHRDCKPTHDFVEHFRDIAASMEVRMFDAIDAVEELKQIRLSLEQSIQVIGNLNVSKRAKNRTIYNLVNAETRLRPMDISANASIDTWQLSNIVNEAIRYEHGKTFTSLKQNETLIEDISELAKAA